MHRTGGAAQRQTEAERFDVARHIARRVGVGDVTGEDLLALAEPLEPLLEDAERRGIAPVHGDARSRSNCGWKYRDDRLTSGKRHRPWASTAPPADAALSV